MHISKVHTISVLQAGDDFGTILDFEIRLHNLDVHNLALGWTRAFGAKPFKLEISVVGEEETGDGVIHGTKSSLIIRLSENRIKALSEELIQLNYR
jgi:hypothetical protein